MKAILLQEKNEIVQLIDSASYKKPEITQADQLLIKIKAAAVNPIDLQIYEGKNERRMLNSDILGREIAGVVEQVGAEVKNFQLGDEVFLVLGSMGSNGAFAEYVVVAEEIVAPKPAHMSYSEAATLPIAYATAWQAAERLSTQAKDSKILILGASGSVGKALINTLPHFGFYDMTGTAGNDNSKAELSLFGLSPEHIVLYTDPHIMSSLSAIHSNFDIVIDCVGFEITEVAAQMLKREGIFVDITNFRTEEASYILFQKAATIMNISRYAEPELHYKYGEILRHVSRLITAGNWKLQQLIEFQGLQAKNLLQAFRLLHDNKTAGRKLILSY